MDICPPILNEAERLVGASANDRVTEVIGQGKKVLVIAYCRERFRGSFK